jgi:hypothetical protein
MTAHDSYHTKLRSSLLKLSIHLTLFNMSSSESSIALSLDTKLYNREGWIDWFILLRGHCTNKHIWEFVDPDGPDVDDPTDQPPQIPTISEIVQQE